MHTNMVGACGSRRAAYEAFIRDDKRDGRNLQITDLLTSISVWYLAFHYLDFLPAFAASVAALGSFSGIRQFVDRSSRNFLMHKIDWDIAGPDDTLS